MRSDTFDEKTASRSIEHILINQACATHCGVGSDINDVATVRQGFATTKGGGMILRNGRVCERIAEDQAKIVLRMWRDHDLQAQIQEFATAKMFPNIDHRIKGLQFSHRLKANGDLCCGDPALKNHKLPTHGWHDWACMKTNNDTCRPAHLMTFVRIKGAQQPFNAEGQMVRNGVHAMCHLTNCNTDQAPGAVHSDSVLVKIGAKELERERGQNMTPRPFLFPISSMLGPCIAAPNAEPQHSRQSSKPKCIISQKSHLFMRSPKEWRKTFQQEWAKFHSMNNVTATAGQNQIG